MNGETWHDPIEVNAARMLFRIGHRDGHRITDLAQMRHMLHWLAVMLDSTDANG